MAIRLYTGRRGDHMSKIFLMVIFFCMSHELLLGANKDFELKFEEFEKNPFLKPDPFSSTLKLDKEKLKEIDPRNQFVSDNYESYKNRAENGGSFMQFFKSIFGRKMG